MQEPQGSQWLRGFVGGEIIKTPLGGGVFQERLASAAFIGDKMAPPGRPKGS